MRNTKFFKYQDITDQRLLTEIASCLKYHYMDKKTLVFDYFDEGSSFYIIIDGSVDVIVPILEDAN